MMDDPELDSHTLRYLYEHLFATDPECRAAFAEADLRLKADYADLIRFSAELAQYIKPDFIPAWWDTPVPALDGETPADVWLSGDRERVWRIVREWEAGAFL